MSDGYEWHILGAGAMGSLFALHLRLAGLPVTLLHQRRNPEDRQLRVDGARHTLSVTPLQALGQQSVTRLLITTKAGQVSAALTQAAPWLAPDCVLICTANGMGFEREIRSAGISHNLLRAVTTAGAYRDEAGRVVVVSDGQTRVGDPEQPCDAPNWFESSLASLDTWTWDSQIRFAIGEKFSLNCLINPLTAYYRCLNGALLDEEEPRAALRMLCDETEPVLRELDLWRGESLWEAAARVCRSTAGNRSSMFQDVLAGRTTEIAYLNGELLRRAPQAALPFNRRLVEALS